MNELFCKGATCTKSAFCQAECRPARHKIKVQFFQDLFALSVQSFYQHQKKAKTFKNYLLWAVDCTVQMMPNNAKTKQMGIHKNQFKETASIKISAHFDILNKIITQATRYDKRKTDLTCCLQDQVGTLPKNIIAIYDRGYGSHILPFLHDFYGSKYLIRLKVGFSNTVKKFVQSPDNEIIITEPLSERCYKELEKFGIRQSKSDTISYRLVKIILSTGETEVLMTNLDKTFTINDLSELYRLRWGIETCFSSLKNHLMLGTFSGYSPTVIQQDIFCNLLFYNLQTISSLEAEKEAECISARRKGKPSKNKRKAHEGYQVNRNIGAGVLRMHFFELFECSEKTLNELLKKVQKYYLQSLEMIKPNKQERRRKMIRTNDRHHTELNRNGEPL